MIVKEDKNRTRQVRHLRTRNQVFGTPERPRLNVFRSNKHIYAQLINDVAGVTLVAASTQDAEVKGKVEKGTTVEAAKVVGKVLARRAQEKGIALVVFDRGGYLYHGRVAALADGARSGGLNF